MENRRKILSAVSLGLLSLLPASSIASAAGRRKGRGEWIVPDGVEVVKVKLVDDQNNVVLSRDVDVKPGYKFSVEVA